MEPVEMGLQQPGGSPENGPRLRDTESFLRDLEAELQRGMVGRAMVTLSLVVGADGRVVSADVVEQSGDSRLERIAVRVSNRLRFLPAERDGCAIPSRIPFPFSTMGMKTEPLFN